jgi:hypothetical protein
MKTINCKYCENQITKPLAKVNDDFVVEYEDAQDVAPKGQYLIADDSFAPRLTDCVVVNIDDVIGAKYHKDKKRKQGCCGYSDSEGPNLVCKCDVEIGSEMSDCWVPRMTYFSPLITELKESEQ